MDLNNKDDNSSDGGNKGKFSERLNRIRNQRLKYRKYGSIKEDEEHKALTFGRNIFKIALALPSVIYSHVVMNNEKNKKKQFNAVNDNIDINDEKAIENIRKLKVKKIKEINIILLKKKRDELVNNNLVGNFNLDDNLVLEQKKKELQKQIIDLIKKKLVKNINEFEMLQSELYILKELGIENIYLSECQGDIKEIRKLLSKVKSLKEKYDYLKDNIDFQYMLEYDDSFLIDKILELKEICSRDDIKHTIDDYKILEEYKYLYLKIDKLQDDIIKFEEEKNKKAIELKQRDVDFEKLKNDLYVVDKEKERYDSFVKQQEYFIKELEGKISKIDSFERVTYRLKGFNKLLGNSFKYLGLLLINPLKGIIPGIATQTLITKNLVHNLYNNLSWEEDRRMVYEAMDYSGMIGNAINDLDYTTSLVDSTLEEIVLLKNKYKSDFSKYSENISSYKDAIQKLNKIENAVLGSKIKIETMKSRMKEKEIANKNKMKMVKKLNENSNSSNN